MNDNLPPGVRVSMIPGNTPEDVALDHAFERFQGYALDAIEDAFAVDNDFITDNLREWIPHELRRIADRVEQGEIP